MPPLTTSPLMLDLGVYLPLPEEIVPSGTHEDVPEYIGAGLALRTLAHIGRLKREGRELRRRRLAAGLSKGQAARLCGVSARQLYRWESGERAVPGWVWERILGDAAARPACSPSVEPPAASRCIRTSPAIATE